MTLWQKHDKFLPDGDYFTWAAGIARRKVLNFHRQLNRTPLMFDAEFVEAVAEERVQRTRELDDRYQALLECVEKLSSRDRELLHKCYQSKTTIKSVARAMGRPVDTLYKTLKRIRQALFGCVNRTLARKSRR